MRRANMADMDSADTSRPARIAIVTVSDRAARGEYPDKGGPGAEDWLRATITSPMQITRTIIPDGRASVAETLRQLCDGLVDVGEPDVAVSYTHLTLPTILRV